MKNHPKSLLKFSIPLSTMLVLFPFKDSIQRQTPLEDCVDLEGFAEQCVSKKEPHTPSFVPALFCVVNTSAGLSSLSHTY